MINKERLLKTFLEYIQIDSESGNELEMANRVIEDFKALGCKISVDTATENCGNVLCVLKGDESLETIMLSAHLDTVTNGKGIKPIITEDGIIKSKGETILGADDKSGIATILELLTVIVENKINHPTIECLFTVGEEVGMDGARNADYSKITAKKCLVLDGDGDVGGISNVAPGHLLLRANINGVAAHAGVAPEKGISAIQVASEAIYNMKLLRIDEETTSNIGTFLAEGSANIVSPKVKLVGECRSFNPQKLINQGEHMIECIKVACKKYGATYEADLLSIYKAFDIKNDDDLINEVVIACKELDITPRFEKSGGGSDANIFNEKGIKSIVISTGMTNVHSTKEGITVENLINTALLLEKVILKN